VAKYYAALQLPATADTSDIRKAYRKLALQYHPDKNPGGAQEEAGRKFREVAEAYEALMEHTKGKK